MSIRPFLSFSLLLPLTALAACGDDGGGGDTLTIGTYNAGLAVSFVPYAEERAPFIMEDFPADTLDLVCVEEFWEQRFWDQLTASVAATHPHTFRRPPEMEVGGTASCAMGDLDDLDTCVRTN